MIKNQYIRHFIYAPIFVLMYVLAFFVFPYSYTLRNDVRRLKDVNKAYKFLWYFLNDETDCGEVWWLVKNNYTKEPTLIQLFRWNVIRNSHWNFKLSIAPEQGKTENIKGEMIFYNVNKPLKLGVQNATYTINNIKYFRYSFTKLLFNRLVWNVQLGTSANRYIYKSKIQWI